MGALSNLMLAGAALAGLSIGLGGSALYDRLIDDPLVARTAKAEGKAEERLAWEELRRRAMLKAEQDRQKAQDEINAADRTVAALKLQGRLRAAAFEAAMKEQKDEDAKSGVDRACGTLPDRMWRALSD